jgi:hypothetical protein
MSAPRMTWATSCPRAEKLVQHNVLARDRRLISVRGLLDVVEGARYERVIDDAPPIDARIGASGAILARLVGAAGARASRNRKGSHAL